MALRPDGLWSSSEVGLMVSRQNGKGSILEAIELWGLFVNEEQILHTAHNFKTASEGFRRIEALIRNNKDLSAEVLRVSRSHGEEGIELRSGARLMFGTRTKGGARGMTLDRVICDEAMYLTAEQSAAILFTVSARPNPQTMYTGSAGTKESTYFGRVRNRALKGDDPRLFYAEWSIDACTDFCVHGCTEHDQPDAVESFAKANPALGYRLSLEHIQGESRSMLPEIFAQERLGVGDWPVDGDGWTVIGRDSWMSRADETSEITGQFALAVDTTPDRAYSCIAVAGLNEHDETHIEITGDEEWDHRPGVQWVVPTVLHMWKALKPACVVIDKAGQAGSFVDELVAAGVNVIFPNSREYAQACGEFYSAVIPRKGERPTLAHLDQPPLTGAVAGADRRTLTDMWAWSKRSSTVDISPLVASTLAMWGYRKHVHQKQSQLWVAFGNEIFAVGGDRK